MNDQNKKLLYISMDSGIPFGGTKGGSIHMREVVNAFTKKNIDVSVVAEKANDNKDSNFETHSLSEIRQDPTLKLTRKLDSGRKFNNEMRDYIRNQYMIEVFSNLHKKHKFDFVYERYSLFGASGLTFAKKKSIPFVLEVNAPLIEEARKYRALVFKELTSKIENYLFSNADHIVAVSEQMSKYILKVTPTANVTVVPNGVRIDHFESIDKPGNEDNGCFTVGFLGSLKPWHGVEILIDSFKTLATQNENVRLLIIGGTEETVTKYKKLCDGLSLNGLVEFTGSVDYDQVPKHLQRTDVLVAPYPKLDEFYFSALKIFEYMAAGKAIIASNIGQISEMVNHEETALLVPPGDSQAITTSLTRLIKDENLKNRLGRNALKVAREKHSWNSRIADILKIYSNIEPVNS